MSSDVILGCHLNCIKKFVGIAREFCTEHIRCSPEIFLRSKKENFDVFSVVVALITMATKCLLGSLTKMQFFKRGFTLSQNVLQGAKSHQPTNLEKRFLVWTGKYKNMGEVPSFVSYEVMERCRNRIRIRLANIMMVATVVGCIVMVISGKRAAERGETVSKQNLEWHKRYNEATPVDVKD